MNMKKNIKGKRASVLALALILLLTALLGGCSKAPAAPEQDENVIIVEAEPSSEAPETAEAAAPGRQDGERFETVIILEGMEETVHYEHIRNETLGFEMDYDYENFVRRSEADRECFISVWDDPEHPENYLEVTARAEDAQTAADAIGAELSKSYEIHRDDACVLDGVGVCIHIDASADVGGLTMPDQLQAVYIIPAPDGCRVATAHYAIEASEGFGRRFHYLMHSFTVLARGSAQRMTDTQALAAIENYCYASNPDLKGIVDAGQYPVSWEIESFSEQEIVVLFRSYTGALIRYTIDPVSGRTTVTEFVPGVTAAEEPTEEQLNAWDYLG